MQIYIVEMVVKPELKQEFIKATLENSDKSRMEPGIMRFEFAGRDDDPNRFILIEAYRSPEAVIQHKETAHYLKWREIVAPMMAQPGQGVSYSLLTPIPAILG